MTIQPTIFLIRHASPDWGRTDLPYNILPGPPLSPKGIQEAQELGVFLDNNGLKKLYFSPFDRSAHTAQIVAALAKVPAVELGELAEWRPGETEPEIHTRFWPVLEASIEESSQIGPLGLVTHGGPVAYLLKQLKIDPARLEKYRRMFDSSNPMPPAGVWAVKRNTGTESWDLELIYTPPQGF